MTISVSGAFVGTGAAINIPVPNGPCYFRVVNQTQQAASQSGAVGYEYEWYSNPSFPVGGANVTYKGSAGAVTTAQISTAGFTYLSGYPAPQSAYVGTAITAASPAVASGFSSLPYSNGDRVVLYNTTGMAQIGGMEFTISSVSSSGFTLLGLPAAGFAAAATAVTARRVYQYNSVLPEFLYITAISQASAAVITVSVDPTNLVYVGQKLVFQIPASFGMVQMNSENLNGIPVIVTAVDYAAYQFTVNVNSSAFTAFAFPASTLSPTAPLFATCAPAGSYTSYNPQLQTYTGYDFARQPFRSSQEFPLMSLAGGAGSPGGAADDIMWWEALSSPVVQYNSGT